MKLLSLKQTPIRGTDEVFVAVSATATGIVAFVFAMLTIAGAYLVVVGRIGSFDPPRLMSGFITAILLPFACLLFARWRAARRPTNWILRIRGSEILIKFRSYQNWKMPEDDVQIVELNRDEIAYVSKSIQRQVTKSMDGHGVTAETRVELEIGLKDGDTSALDAALAEERSRPGGGKHIQSKTLDYPVSTDNGVIRVAWKSQSGNVKPGIDAALARLGKIAKVIEAQTREADFTPSALRKLPEAEQKTKLTELARRDKMAALRTVAELYKCSTSDAMKRVEELAGAGDVSQSATRPGGS